MKPLRRYSAYCWGLVGALLLIKAFVEMGDSGPLYFFVGLLSLQAAIDLLTDIERSE
jgi:hypothetical protein